MDLRKEIKLALEKGRIEAPYPKRMIMKGWI
jgi:small-conductance mechanosensitive channel